MKTCTGEQYDGQFNHLSIIEGWHGCYGHLNVLKKDHDDICTHYGRHDRIVTFLPQYDEEVDSIAIYARIDHVWGLGMPSQSDINYVIHNHDEIKGQWVIVKTVHDDTCTHIWLTRK